ncbi:MAG: TVP38/TMEM64 family protein [Elusimicrobia bacterium]|nr:TVP38/TMEM64 family protein [Elusimicrobiota bacterium]
MNARAGKFAALIAGLLAIALLARFSPLAPYLNKDSLLAFIRILRNVWWGPIAFIAAYACTSAVGLPAIPFVLGGGAVFGTLWGTIYNAISANIGASLAFLVARFMGRDFVASLLKDGKLAALDAKAAQHGFQTILTLRLLPFVPFNGLNFAAGISKIRYRDFALGSLAGMLPGTFIYTYFADSILSGTTGVNGKAFVHLFLAAMLMVFLSMTPKIFKKWLPANRKKNPF